MCLFGGVGSFPKSPGIPDSLAPNTRWWCGWERDRVKVNTGGGDMRQGETGWIPRPVSQNLLGLVTALA